MLRRVHAVLLLAPFVGRLLSAQSAQVSFVRVHMEADRPSATTMTAPVKGGAAAAVLEAQPSLDLGAIARAYPQRLHGEADYAVLIALTDAGKAAFAQATGRHISRRVAVVVDDTVTKLAVVRSALRGPIPIADGLSEARATALADRITAQVRLWRAP